MNSGPGQETEEKPQVPPRGLMLVGLVAVSPLLFNLLMVLLQLPSKSKLLFGIIFCVAAWRTVPRYYPIFLLTAFPWSFVSMIWVTQFIPSFPHFYATLTFMTFFAYLGAYRGFDSARLILIPVIVIYPYTWSWPGSPVSGIWFYIGLYVLVPLTVFFASFDFLRSMSGKSKRIKQFGREVWRAGQSRLNLLLGLLLLVLVALRIFGTDTQQEEGGQVVLSLVRDFTRIISDESRERIITFFNLENYGWVLIYAVFSYLMFTVANHHAKTFFNKSYYELIFGRIGKKKDPFVRGPFGATAIAFGFFIYWFILLAIFPTQLSMFRGNVTWTTTAWEIFGGAAIGLTIGLAVRFSKNKIGAQRWTRFKRKLLKVYAQKPAWLRYLRVAIYFGPAVILSPFFAWKSLLSTTVLILGCYALAS